MALLYFRREIGFIGCISLGRLERKGLSFAFTFISCFLYGLCDLVCLADGLVDFAVRRHIG